MRILAQQLSAQLGVALVVENKPGASFTIGTMDVVKAAPDGYTLGYGNIVSLAINRSLLAKVPYDVDKDLTLVSNCVRVFNLLAVNNRLAVRERRAAACRDQKGACRARRRRALQAARHRARRRHARRVRRARAARDAEMGGGDQALRRQGRLSLRAHYDLILRHATVVDGTRAPRYTADIAVRGERIAAIGRLDSARAGTELDASGRIVAPGFIDAHTHDDRLMLSAPEMAPKVSQGVTTVVAGNCGVSLAPAPRGMPRPVIPPLDLLANEGTWFRYKNFSAYVSDLNAHPAATNCALLVGHTMLRAQTMDDVEKPASTKEIAAMQAMVEEALDAGAIGVSTGLYYEPARAAPTEEVIEICRPLTAHK